MRRTALPSIALAALLVLALAACDGSKVSPGTAVVSPASPAPTATAVATPADPPPPARAQRSYDAPASALASPGPNQRRAVADVDAILAKFVAPPGSHQLPGAPRGSWRELEVTPGGTGPYNSVTDTSWWQVPGQPQAIAAWVKAHAPRGSTASGPSLWGPSAVRPGDVYDRTGGRS